jgi:hypothetical protein
VTVVSKEPVNESDFAEGLHTFTVEGQSETGEECLCNVEVGEVKPLNKIELQEFLKEAGYDSDFRNMISNLKEL